MTLLDFGKPALIDESDVPHRYARYRSALPGIGLVCPAEQVHDVATAQWVRRHGLTVAVHTSNQLAQLVSLGIDPTRLVVFGEGAQWGPIRCAVKAGVRQFVVGSTEQAAIVEHCAPRGQQVVVDVAAHDVDAVVASVCGSDRLELVGLHAALDSRAPGAHRYAVAVDDAIERMDHLHRRHGVIATRLSLAGPLWNSPRIVASVIETAVEDSCARHHFPRPSVALVPEST